MCARAFPGRLPALLILLQVSGLNAFAMGVADPIPLPSSREVCIRAVRRTGLIGLTTRMLGAAELERTREQVSRSMVVVNGHLRPQGSDAILEASSGLGGLDGSGGSDRPRQPLALLAHPLVREVDLGTIPWRSSSELVGEWSSDVALLRFLSWLHTGTDVLHRRYEEVMGALIYRSAAVTRRMDLWDKLLLANQTAVDLERDFRVLARESSYACAAWRVANDARGRRRFRFLYEDLLTLLNMEDRLPRDWWERRGVGMSGDLMTLYAMRVQSRQLLLINGFFDSFRDGVLTHSIDIEVEEIVGVFWSYLNHTGVSAEFGREGSSLLVVRTEDGETMNFDFSRMGRRRNSSEELRILRDLVLRQ